VNSSTDLDLSSGHYLENDIQGYWPLDRSTETDTGYVLH